MIRIIKGLLAIVLILMITSSGCEKEEVWMDHGTITGPDFRKCMCCGGWFINIKKEQYRFYKLPKGSDLDLTTESFPIEVQLNWEKDTTACMGDEIIIKEIKKLYSIVVTL